MGESISDVQHVVQLSTNIGKRCEHCSEYTLSDDDLAANINHYIDRHGYRLLHVGTDTCRESSNGGMWHATIALLGK